MINLIKNALKFTTLGQIDIKMSYSKEEKLLIVHVKDTGVGIAKEDLPKLFQKFGKLHRTADLNHGGIGLGLTIVKEIVEKSGGKICVRSKGIGHGSIFIFSMQMDMVDAEYSYQEPRL